jgi:hypothetical protein
MTKQKEVRSIALQPQTEEEHIIHAINIHGIFFERWCQKTIIESPNWQVKSTNYPVEFPPSNGFVRGKDSRLDIRAEFRNDELVLTLLIECKKNNPEFINWIFFPHYKFGMMDVIPTINCISNAFVEPPNHSWQCTSLLTRFPSIFKVTDEARETRGSYLEFKSKGKNLDQLTKTSNTAITDASMQIALASKAIFLEEINFSKVLADAQPKQAMPYKHQLFIPAIVTTAKLFVCNFNTTDVSGSTGEIPLDKANIEEYPYLLFEYAMPCYLHSRPLDLVSALSTGGLEQFMRMDILVINSMHFSQVLSTLEKSLTQLAPKPTL